MAADVRGYYSALGLKPGASADAVRQAFRRLAKECHPDRPGCVDGGQRFRRIAEAYEALSDATLKSGYDAAPEASSPNQAPPPPPPPKVEPVKCEVCGNVTAQPRRLAFWRVTGLVLGAARQPVQRIFCQGCAQKEEWKSTIHPESVDGHGVNRLGLGEAGIVGPHVVGAPGDPYHPFRRRLRDPVPGLEGLEGEPALWSRSEMFTSRCEKA